MVNKIKIDTNKMERCIPVISPKLYLESMIQKDIYLDSMELIRVDYELGGDSTNSYWKGRKRFIQQQIIIKENLISDIKNKF